MYRRFDSSEDCKETGDSIKFHITENASQSNNVIPTENSISFLENVFKNIPFEEILLLGLILILLEDKKRDWPVIIAVAYLYMVGREEFCDMLGNITGLLGNLA